MSIGKALKNKYFLLIFWCLLIFIGSSLPGASVSRSWIIDFILHKGVHIFEYGVLWAFAYRAFIKNWKLAFLFTILYSLSDEFHQTFVPGRNGRIEDATVDFVGSLLGAIYLWKFSHIVQSKLKMWLKIWPKN